jgi:hypothetical protein
LILTFEVAVFRGAYHAILGRSCYAKFMAVPNYTYLKMKMPGPKGVITMGSSIEHAFDCDVECIEHTEALALDEVLVASMEKLVTRTSTPPPSTQKVSRLPSRQRRCPSTLLPTRARR